MITDLSIRNFKNLAAVPPGEGESVEFGPLNVLIGPNGCGKSSLLQAIDFLRAFFRSSVEVYLNERGWDYHDLPNLRQTRKTITWTVQADLGSDDLGRGAGRYRYTVSLQPKKHLGVGEESLDYLPAGSKEGFPRKACEMTLNALRGMRLLERQGRECSIWNGVTHEPEKFRAVGLPASLMSEFDPASDSDREKYPELLRFRQWVEQFRSYLIWDPKVLRAPDRGRNDEIGPSGEHLASVIGRLKDRNRAAFEKLVKRLRLLFPTITDLSVRGRGWGWRTIQLQEGAGNGTKAVFNSQQMSDGVLRLLAVTSMLYLDQVPSVLTFEEPENGVHPQLLREVVQILRELTQRKPPHRCQVFFTTHSPCVLDEFYDHPEEVYCMERPPGADGARITRLSENKQLHIVRGSFEKSLGEAWLGNLLGAGAR